MQIFSPRRAVRIRHEFHKLFQPRIARIYADYFHHEGHEEHERIFKKLFVLADSTFKCNDYKFFNTKTLATRKIVRGPRVQNYPPAALILLSAQTIFLSVQSKNRRLWYPLLLHLLLESAIAYVRQICDL